MTTATEASAVDAMIPTEGMPRDDSWPNTFGKSPSFGRRERHLGADHGPAVECADAGDDDKRGDEVAGPSATEDVVGGRGVGRLVAVLRQGGRREDAEHGDQREHVHRSAGEGSAERGARHVVLRVAHLGGGYGSDF